MLPCTILLESGHGKGMFGLYDPGCTFENEHGTMMERAYTLLIGTSLQQILINKVEDVVTVGIHTAATVRRKIEYANSVITDRARKGKQCIYVSLHVNSTRNPDANGFEFWLEKDNPYGAESQELATQLALSCTEYTKLKLRGTKDEYDRSRSYMRYINAPAVLCEMGFMSNQYDRKFLYEQWNRWSEGIAHGICQYLRLCNTRTS